MRKLTLFLLLFQAMLYSYAQTGNPDSIIQLIKTDKEDTSRVIHLADLSYEFFESKPDTSMILSLQALALSRRIGFVKGEAISLNRVANAYSVLGNYSKSMEIYFQALQLNEKINNPDIKGANFNSIGAAYRAEGEYRLALDYFFKARTIAEQINNKYLLSRSLYNVGQCYLGLQIYDSASVYALQAYNAANSINYFRVIGTALKGMGNIDFATNQNILALEHYRLSFPYLKKAGSYNALCAAYVGISKVFEKLQQKDSALFYAKESFILAKEMGFVEELRDAARFLSHFYREFNADSAFFYQDISRDANDSIFSQQKQREFQSLTFDEKLRQQEIIAAEVKAKEERKQNIQYAAIAIRLISFVILFLLLSRSIIVKTKFIEFFGVLGLLAVFEFINLFIHPYLAHATNDSPVLMLVVLIAIGALLIPLHHKMEKWITKIMVEKNKKIRLEAAKKTIATLEG